MNLSLSLYYLLPSAPRPKPRLVALRSLMVPAARDGRDLTCARVDLCNADFLRAHERDKQHWNSHATCPKDCAGRVTG